ncbi:MAG: malto-oligosyltrehalose synthase, partial [Candidatus Omnitrophica bacterium]|nr:malto-oligosyltrehalose synthase [Candidatus Omnitrophota bacterium]
RDRAENCPHAMSASATHDTKRGEDARARLNVLSEIPREWRTRVKVWQLMNQDKKTSVKGRMFPDKNDEYFLYQSVIGGYPFAESERDGFIGRLKEYMIKAVREAKRHTAWISPDEPYETACLDFIDRIFDERKNRAFVKDFCGFQRKIADYGIYNSLAQTVLKLTAPGVPDFYQGTEDWDLSFVDPDNRRPVDFPLRSARLEEAGRRVEEDLDAWLRELLDTKVDGRIKQFVIWRILQFRKTNDILFREGMYVPLKVAGRLAEHALAFARQRGDQCCVVVVPRFLTGLVNSTRTPIGKVWSGTDILLPRALRHANWRQIISGKALGVVTKSLVLEDVFREFPVAVIEGRLES